VITTRGERFINDLTTIKAQTDEYINSLETAGVGKYMKWMRENFPDPTIIRDRFRKGEFLFFPVENKMHIEDCTGETLIPETYFKQHYGPHLVSFKDDADDFQQSIVVLKS